jgi:hypothetical protein
MDGASGNCQDDKISEQLAELLESKRNKHGIRIRSKTC